MSTLDALRTVLAEHADDAVTLDPMDAAAGPRLAGVRDRVRRTRRRRTATAGLAAVAAVAGVLVAVSVPPDTGTRQDRPAQVPTTRTTATSLDVRGVPPLADPAGRPLQAATTLDATGPREAKLRFTPTDGADGGVTLLLHCSGGSGSRAAWFAGGRRLGDAPCGPGRGASFVTLSAQAWAGLGATPGKPFTVVLRLVHPGDDEVALSAIPRTSALIAVYEADDPRVSGPPLLSDDVRGRRDGVAGLDRDVRLPLVREADGGPSRLLVGTDLPVGPAAALRAFRFTPGTLDGLLAAVACPTGPGVLGGRPIEVSVGDAVAELACTNPDGTSPAVWPEGDAGPTWRGYGVADGPVTVVVRLPAAPSPDGADHRAPDERVDERIPDVVAVGFYGVPAVPVEPPGTRNASLAALSEPPASYEGLPLLGTRDLVAEDTTASLPVTGTLRRVVVRYECVGEYTSLVLMVGRTSAAGEGSRTGAPCDGTGPRRLDLGDGTDLAAWSGGSLDAGIGLTANDADAAAPIAGLSRSAVVRVTFYGR